MIIIKFLKRLLWDIWLVPLNILRDYRSYPKTSNEAVLDLYKAGLHCPANCLSSEKLSLLEEIYLSLMDTASLPTSGQGTGRLSANGMLDERLKEIIEPMQKIANEYLCVCNANLELTYFQESKPSKDINNVPGGKFHIDDNKANLKFFVYLSDVTSLNGPFAVVPKTHRWSEYKRIFRAFDSALTKRRDALYFRSDDAYLREKAVQILGPKGTTFIADTTCWHKAEPVLDGSRKVFVASFNR